MQAEGYRIGVLDEGDATAVTALYAFVHGRTPEGHLAFRRPEEFAALFADPDSLVAVGAWWGTALAAYSLCRRSSVIPYDPQPFLDLIHRAGGSIYLGMGTVVHPSHEGRLLMARLMATRGEELKARNACHVLGLAAIGNLPSIANILRAGAILVGFSRDETAMNYIGYGGLFQPSVNHGAPRMAVAQDDFAAQQELFSQGQVIVAMNRGGSGERYFDFLPLLPETLRITGASAL
ncbi:hypothetical protein [Aestuariivirga sp.]|uniref:hypothetical protein n=1 Tax=Aestuariivirga sp. TaxID=2650926 RepID=UPI0039E5790C